jgi:heat shock protein HslJ
MKRRFCLPVLVAGALTLTLLVATACYPVTQPSAAPAAAPATMSISANTITGIVWQWVSVTDQATKLTTTVPNPNSYTIIFDANGSASGKADCNTFTGTWSQQNGFHIQVTPTVMSACGTLDSQYLTLLNQVAAGGPDGVGNLILQTSGGAQSMLFRNGGPAPAAPAPTPAPVNTIIGIVWQWVSVTDQTTRQTTTVPNPASYTIIFNANGTTNGKADCNTFTGTWSQQNGFHIQVTPTVMSACGTLDSQYLTLLNQVAAGARMAPATWLWKRPAGHSACCSGMAAPRHSNIVGNPTETWAGRKASVGRKWPARITAACMERSRQGE